MDGLLHVVRSVFLLCVCAVTTYASDYCFDDYDNEYDWCNYGCCGSAWSNDRKCCDGSVVAVWVIVLSVIGAILLISTIITIVCCFVKKKSHQGQVVSPNTGATVTHSTVYTTGPTYYPSYTTYPQGPPAYQAQGYAPPPPMPYTNPAYPPPTAPPPAYGQMNNTQTSGSGNFPEGLQAPPPASNPLPGNHRVV